MKRQNKFRYSMTAFCEYCYQTHSEWQFAGDRSEPAWICEKCDHCTPDKYMQVSKEGKEKHEAKH